MVYESRERRSRLTLIVYAALVLVLAPFIRCSNAGAADTDTSEVRKELRILRAQMERDRRRMEEDRGTMEQDRRRIEQLQHQVEVIQSNSTQKTTELEQKSKALEEKVAQVQQTSTTPSTAALNQYVDRFVGNNRFLLTGDFAINYTWNDRTHTNSFAVDNFAPIFLYQASDRLLFEGEVEFLLSSTESETPELEFAQADYVLNKYMTLVAGKFLLPFGEYIERLHQKWIRKLVDRPLMYRPLDQGGIMQDNGVGLQLRGAIPLGYGDGTFAEYSAYVINGPRFESDARGAFFADNHVDNNQGKGYGARIGVDLLPIDLEAGRLHLSASTLDGEWDSRTAAHPGDKSWFYSWGLAFDYQMLPFELRGEYMQDHRKMPPPLHSDKREGWYVEGSYLLNQMASRYLNGTEVGSWVGRTELITRWSAVNQNSIADATDSFTAFSRKPREIALGVDYWIAPSVVTKFEFKRVFQHDKRDFNAFLTSFAYGF